jgi:hypothetical protein
LDGVEVGGCEEESVALWGVFEELDLALGVASQNLMLSKSVPEAVNHGHTSVLFSL